MRSLSIRNAVGCFVVMAPSFAAQMAGADDTLKAPVSYKLAAARHAKLEVEGTLLP